MAENGNGHNGSLRMLIIVFGTVISGLLTTGIIGGVIMYGQFQALKVTVESQGALIAAQGKDIAMMKADMYTTRFSKSGASFPNVRASSPTTSASQ
jgi:hypothetical protein